MTRFLYNDSLWDELTRRAKSAGKVKAAVAFVGKGGADLLPLKKGDTLVVNLGLNTVKQGATSPKEIQRLIKRGVQVFTRSNLHAKFFIFGKTLVVGSANISNHSQNVLDEAGTLTTDNVALRRAEDYFDKICTEPVRPDYLELCLQEYRAPAFQGAGKERSSSRQKRAATAKLWFIGGLAARDVPAEEKDAAERIFDKASKQLKQSQGTYVDPVHYPSKPKFFEDIRVGDWIVPCVAESDKNRLVWPPRQVLGQESYSRGHGKRRYLLNAEAPSRGEPMSLKEFRRHMRKFVPQLDVESPRTRPITDLEAADKILGLWTPKGRIASQRKAKSKTGRGLGYEG